MKNKIYVVLDVLFILLVTFSSASPASNENVIIFGSNVDGYLNACTCPGNLYGGLVYVDGVLKKIRSKYPQALFLDSGDLFPAKDWKPKARYAIEFYNGFKTSALNIGDQEFQFGVDFLMRMDSLANFPFLSANIYRQGHPLFKPYIIKEMNGIKIGIIGVVASDLILGLLVEKRQDIEIRKIDDVLPGILSELDKKTDIIVVLSHSGLKKDKLLAKYRKINLILGAHSREILMNPIKIKQTSIFQVGSFAHYLCEIKIIKTPGQNFQFKQKLIKLEGAPVTAHAQSLYQDYLTGSDQFLDSLAQNANKNPVFYQAAPAAEACGRCHYNAYNQWVRTPHAHAWETIEQDGRTNDLSCVSCHTTLFRKPQGFIDKKTTPGLVNVSCVSCHIGYQGHGANNTAMQKVSKKICLDCHTRANSPQFSFSEYKPAVLHKLNYYTVKRGDWLSKIAQRYYSDLKEWKTIFKANGIDIDNPDKIYPNQKLIIPVIPHH